MTGIQQAAQIRKEVKREKKIQMMEEAIVRAEMKTEVMEAIKKY